jgi:hypothetical protein
MSSPDRKLRAVTVGELPEIWGKVRPELERIARHSDGWLPEDVYVLLVTGHASLYVNDGEWRGFCVLQVLPNYTGKRLHIWIAHGWDVEEHAEEVIDLAKQAGCRKVTFESPRRGWWKRAEHFGFKETRCVYERNIT